MSGKALTDDFADEVADLVRSAQGLEAPGCAPAAYSTCILALRIPILPPKR